MAILKVEGLSYSYQDGGRTRVILDTIDYQFNDGLFYTILGESGSGKTTFISLIAGLDNADYGDIIFKDQNIKKIGLTKYRRSDMGIIFQEYNLIPYMTAVENITSAMSIAGDKEDKLVALELLKRVGISKDISNRKVTTLSGGEKQRVAIARSLVGNKKIIIADEPTGNLDKKTSDAIIDIFVKLAHEENKCVIVVTHSQDLANKSDVQLYLDSTIQQFIEKR